MKAINLKNFLFSFFSALIILSTIQIISAQTKVYTPAKGSAERKAVFDGIRKYRKSTNEIYNPDSLRMQNGWAFTVIPDPNEPDVDTLRLHLLLRKTGNTWKVLGQMEIREGETWGTAVSRMRKKFPSSPKDIFQ